MRLLQSKIGSTENTIAVAIVVYIEVKEFIHVSKVKRERDKCPLLLVQLRVFLSRNKK